MVQKVYIYARVSTKKQGNYLGGHASLECQRTFCRNYARNKKWTVEKIVSEEYSARDMDKMKCLRSLLNVMRDGSILLFYNLSRFSRNTRQALNLIEKLKSRGITLVSAQEDIDTSTAFGRQTLRSQLSSAEYESDVIGERVRRVREFKKSLGGHVGSVPYGYKTEAKEVEHEGNLVMIKEVAQDTYERKVIRFILEAYRCRLSSDELTSLMMEIKTCRDSYPIVFYDEEGDVIDHLKPKSLTHTEIATLLNNYEVTRRGKVWTSSSVSTIVSKYLDDPEFDEPMKKSSVKKTITKGSKKPTRKPVVSTPSKKVDNSRDKREDTSDSDDSDMDELGEVFKKTKLTQIRSRKSKRE